MAGLLLAVCVPTPGHFAGSAEAPKRKPVWIFETSDIPLDRKFRFGHLANGMRCVICCISTSTCVDLEVANGHL